MLSFDFDVTGTETVRQTGQTFLEKLQSEPTTTTARGATPFQLAQDMSHVAMKYHSAPHLRFLEPCVGSGVFYSALLHEAAHRGGHLTIESAHGIERDVQFAALAHDLWAPAGLEVHDYDFMYYKGPEFPKATVVLSRPPSTPHHELTATEKLISANTAEAATGLRPTGLADIYHHFVLAAHAFLADDAVSAWLLPSKFLDDPTSQILRNYLTSQVRLQRIHQYEPHHFDAVKDWSVVVFTNAVPETKHFFQYSISGELATPGRSVEVTLAQAVESTNWREFVTGAPGAARMP